LNLQTDTSGPLRENLQILSAFLDNAENTEICINAPGVVFTESRKGWKRHELPELTLEKCRHLAKYIASYSGQKLDEVTPVVSATLPTGERVQLVTSPAVPRDRVSITIRKPSNVELSLDDYQRAGAFDVVQDSAEDLSPEEEQLTQLQQQKRYKEFLELAVASRQNIIVSGSTGSGKTTLMKTLINLVPNDERLLSIENVDELKIYVSHQNVVPLFYSAGGLGVSEIDQQQLLESSLRMKPDRIFLAELIRGDEAFYYLRNVNSGHPGSITSMHANSAKLAIEQLVLFLKESQSGSTMSRQDIKQLLFMCVDVIVQMKVINRKRVITEIYYDPLFKRAQMG
ncbi:P-type DNA transfer ATPase VirB11, partial [Thiolapillus sp.]